MGKLNLPYFQRFLAFLTVFLLEFLKKKNSLHWYFFERNLNLQSEWQKYEFENLTSHRGKLFSGLQGRAKIFERKFKIHMDRKRIRFQIKWHFAVICSMKSCGKKCVYPLGTGCIVIITSNASNASTIGSNGHQRSISEFRKQKTPSFWNVVWRKFFETDIFMEVVNKLTNFN